jgi:ABC-type polar amino acid transport system ATPase subunit
MSRVQQQMLAIGRALMARPGLDIFDEISLGLAPVTLDKLYEALALLKRARMTLIVIEQDVDRALALADYAYPGAGRLRTIRPAKANCLGSKTSPHLRWRCRLTRGGSAVRLWCVGISASAIF